MSWQLIIVGAIEAAAVIYLVWFFAFRSRSKRPSKKPDVRVSDLTKKKR